MTDDRFYIAQIEQELQRGRSTIATWERNGWLPEGCQLQRDEKGWRYWTPEQLERVREWMASRNQQRVKHSLKRTRRS